MKMSLIKNMHVLFHVFYYIFIGVITTNCFSHMVCTLLKWEFANMAPWPTSITWLYTIKGSWKCNWERNTVRHCFKSSKVSGHHELGFLLQSTKWFKAAVHSSHSNKASMLFDECWCNLRMSFLYHFYFLFVNFYLTKKTTWLAITGTQMSLVNSSVGLLSRWYTLTLRLIAIYSMLISVHSVLRIALDAHINIMGNSNHCRPEKFLCHFYQ